MKCESPIMFKGDTSRAGDPNERNLRVYWVEGERDEVNTLYAKIHGIGLAKE